MREWKKVEWLSKSGNAVWEFGKWQVRIVVKGEKMSQMNILEDRKDNSALLHFAKVQHPKTEKDRMSYGFLNNELVSLDANILLLQQSSIGKIPQYVQEFALSLFENENE